MLLLAWIPKDDENPLSTIIGEEGDLLCAK